MRNTVAVKPISDKVGIQGNDFYRLHRDGYHLNYRICFAFAAFNRISSTLFTKPISGMMDLAGHKNNRHRVSVEFCLHTKNLSPLIYRNYDI